MADQPIFVADDGGASFAAVGGNDYAVFITGIVPEESSDEYIMRAYDNNLGSFVTWISNGADPTGSQYSSPGDLQGGTIRGIYRCS